MWSKKLSTGTTQTRQPARLADRLITVSVGLVLAAAIALVLARIAVWLQVRGILTNGLLPVVLGGILGVGVAFIAARTGESNRVLIVLGACAAALLMTGAEHVFFYSDYCSQYSASLSSDPKAQWARNIIPDQYSPATFTEFMVAEAPAKWPLWIVSALAMIAVAAFTAWWLSPRRPLTTDH